MTFPDTPLPISVQLNIGGTWTDVALDGDVRGDGLTGVDISRGITSSGGTVADRGSCALTLDNTSGKYSSRNPRSPYFGLIGRNTGLRVGCAYGAPWLDVPDGASVAATTPDSTALSVTGDLDVRVDASLAVWGDGQHSPAQDVTLAGKWDATGTSWTVSFTSDGMIHFAWSDGGPFALNAYSNVVYMPPGSRLTVRATLDVDNGASGHTVTFYTSTGGVSATSWTQVGVTTVSGTTSIADSTAVLAAGDVPAYGGAVLARRVYAVQVRSGIGGTVVADADFTAQTVGATGFTDSASAVWTVPAGGISNTYRRFTGRVSSWPPQWTTGGFDVTTPIIGTGRLQQLGQGQRPLQSTLRRYLPTQATIIGYWPMEDGATATQAASGLAGGTPMAVKGLTFGQDTTLAGSDALPQTGSSASWRAPVTGATAGAMRVEVLVHIPQALTANLDLFTVTLTGGTYAQWTVRMVTDGTTLLELDPGDGSAIREFTYPVPASNSVMTGTWQRVVLTARQDGVNVDFDLAFANDTAEVNWYSQKSFGAATLGTPVSASGSYGSAVQGMTLGHVAAYSDFDEDPVTGLRPEVAGRAGETAAARFTRVCGESGVPVSISGLDAGTLLMGPQPHGTVLDVVTDAATTDEALLTEALEFDGLRMRTRASLYNQESALDLDYAGGVLVAPLTPTEDDQRLLNDSTVSRSGGSSGRYMEETGPLSVQDPPAGVGDYDEEITRNLYTDEQTVQSAAWRVHVGTWDEARFPTVTIYVEKDPSLIPAVCAIDTGSRIRITGTLPDFLPPGPIDLLVLGYQETFAQFAWHITYACVPYGPWQVGVLDDDVLGRADTAGAELAAAAGAADTTLSVATTSGPLWTTSAAEFPFDVQLGGEVVTVTAISGTSSPQSFTVTRAVNGISKSQSEGTDVRLTTPMILAL